MMMDEDEDELWWLQEDCKHLYKHIALANHHHHHHNHKKKKKAIRVTRRARLLRLGINQAFGLCKRYPQHEIHCLEFGVYEGKDLARICNFLEYLTTQNNNVPPPTTRTTRTKSQHKHDHSSSSTIVIHGFDSFEGLPEDWHNGQICENNGRLIHEKGAFSMNGQVPEMDKVCQGLELKQKKKGQFNNKKKIPTVVFHKGWFHETVPQYLQQTSTSNTSPPRPPPPNVDDTSTTSSPPHAPLLLPPPHRRPMIVAFVHADADLYSSTRTFLNFLCQYKVLVKGSILVFDEYWNYPNWQQGEYMAWQEITQQYHIEYEYIGYHAPPLSYNHPLHDDYFFDDDKKKNKNNSYDKMNNKNNNINNNKRKKNTYGYQSVCIRVTRVQ